MKKSRARESNPRNLSICPEFSGEFSERMNFQVKPRGKLKSAARTHFELMSGTRAAGGLQVAEDPGGWGGRRTGLPTGSKEDEHGDEGAAAAVVVAKTGSMIIL